MDTIKKEKIATFVPNNKAFTVTINNETFQIKEERKLLNFLVVSRTRPDLDLPTELGKYEFCDTSQYICIRWNIKPRKEKK